MMGIHTWERKLYTIPSQTISEFAVGEARIPPYEIPEVEMFERRDTEGLTPPEGEGWYLVSAFGVGAVPGAGGSPARPAKKRLPKT